MLMQANPSQEQILFPGLSLPTPEALTEITVQPAAPVQPETKLICLTTVYGDTLSGIAALFNTTVEDIARINGIVNPDLIFPGVRLYLRVPASTPIAACEAYTVRKGDTLSGIAQRLRLDADALAEANGLFDPNLIFPDQVLRIVGQGSEGEATTA